MMKSKWFFVSVIGMLAFSGIQSASAQTPADNNAAIDARGGQFNDARNQSADRGFYTAFNTNYALNYEGDSSFNGMSFIARLGYDLNQYFAVEAESGWMFLDADSSGVDLGTLNVVPLIGNVVVKYPVTERFTPYASGGFGVFFFGFNESDTLENLGVKVDFDNAAVGFKVAVGADYWVRTNWALNFETGYYFIADPDARTTIGGTKFTGEGDVDTWYIGGGIKYKFA